MVISKIFIVNLFSLPYFWLYNISHKVLKTCIGFEHLNKIGSFNVQAIFEALYDRLWYLICDCSAAKLSQYQLNNTILITAQEYQDITQGVVQTKVELSI